MKQLLSLIAILSVSALLAQNPFEKEILQSKYTIDSIVATEKLLLYKREAAVQQSLKEGKITKEQSAKMLKEIKEASELSTKQKTYKEGLRLSALIQQKATELSMDTLQKNTTLDSLISTEPKENYIQTVQQLDSLPNKYNENKHGVTVAIHLAIGLQSVTNDKTYFNPYLNTELGLAFTSQLYKKKQLSLNYGLVWQSNRLNIKGNNYLISENDDTKLVPFSKPLDRAKLRVNYLILPIELQKNFKSKIHIGGGAYFGALIDVNQKIKYTEGDDHLKLFLRNGLKVNKFTYGLSAQVGNKWFSIYAKYSLAPLFENSPNNIHPFSIGIKF